MCAAHASVSVVVAAALASSVGNASSEEESGRLSGAGRGSVTEDDVGE